MIIVANNILFSYVIQEYTIPDHSKRATWEEKAYLAAPHTGNRYMMNKLVVHNIIMCNNSETLHAYTYIKTRIRKNNGLVYMGALKARYQNQAMQYMYINEAKKALENISYKKKRAIKLEIFSGKFQNALNILETYGHIMNNEDIVDMMWPKLQIAYLSMFVLSLKVEYRRNRQNYLTFFGSGLQGSKAYSLWDGVFPNPSIGYDYL